MNNWKRLFQSSLGKKYVMALTGLLLFFFVIVHMLGNLQIFLGPEKLNGYAAFLKATPSLLWGGRIGLLVLVILHITSAILLVRENRAARPVGYASSHVVAASFASQTILFSGLIVLAFVIYHLLHFTIGVVEPSYLELRDYAGRHDVYRMMIEGFSNIGVAIFYILSMGLLCLHLSHGVSSLFQSLGLRSKATEQACSSFARIAAAVIFIGNCMIPIAVLAKWVK